MKYEEMSDQQINHAVGMIVSRDNISAVSATGEVCVHDFNDSGLCVAWKVFDPCNSWADAGPIIHHELISIGFDDDGYQIPESGWSYAKSPCGKQFYGKVNSPLRTAMIVFLMMKEADNG